MRIIFATPVPPVLTKPRPHHFLIRLAGRGHEMHLVCQVSSTAERDALNDDPAWLEVRNACAATHVVVEPKLRSIGRCAASLPTRTPLRVAYCHSRRFADVVAGLVADLRPDVLHVDRPRLASLLGGIPVPKLLDATDSLSLYLRRSRHRGPMGERMLALVESPRISRYERTMGTGFSTVIVTTKEDADALRATGLRAPVQVVPNGVDDGFFEVDRDPQGGLVFVGGMHYPPNIDAVTWFTQTVMPRIWQHEPDVDFTIVGSEPASTVRRLERDPRITVTGWVPDVRPHLARAAVFVAPMRVGGGYPNKVAEALAAGIPTVATPVAHAGLDGSEPGLHFLEAERPQDFADLCLRIIRDPALAGRLSSAGRLLMARRHHWDFAVDKLEGLLTSAQGPGFVRV